jgi:hypothetical protein
LSAQLVTVVLALAEVGWIPLVLFLVWLLIRRRHEPHGKHEKGRTN